ncbi:MAG: FHA domain-containing protein [Prevotella sp.]|nr:FHA domain-containing protein [Prevotella sp.]
MKTITIGRGDGCQIFIDDDMISRRHAILKISTFGKMEIVDMGKNGTFVNGIRLRPNVPVPVKRKDVVSFANVSQLDWKQVPNPGVYYKWGAIILGVLLLLLVGLIVYRNVIDTPQPKPAPSYDYYEEPAATTPETPGTSSQAPDTTGTQKPKDQDQDKDDAADKKKEKEDDLKGKSVKDLEFAPTPKPAAPKTQDKKDKAASKDAGKAKQQQPKQQPKQQQPKQQPAQKNNNQNVIM